MPTAPALDELKALLAEAGLPHTDLTKTHLEEFIFAHEDEALVGAIGLELAGPDALLRSLVVAPEHRGEGIGGRLVGAIETLARQQGVSTLYLLTETAEAFFAARGYRRTDRRAVPAAIARTTEFTTLCGDTAVCMAKCL